MSFVKKISPEFGRYPGSGNGPLRPGFVQLSPAWLLLVGLVLACFLLTATSVLAQSPRLDRIDQPGGQQGTTFSLRCQGEQLTDLQDVLFYRPGLTVKSLRSIDSTTAEITLQSAQDCPLGEHTLRLVTRQGVSELRTIHIGPYQHIQEIEPNSKLASAQRIELGRTIHGRIDQGDVDHFQVTLTKGQRLSAEVVGIRMGGYLSDFWLAVLDSQGQQLASCDDTALLKQDPIVSIVAPQAGRYTVQIREAAFGGDLDSVYQLHIGSHPRPMVAYPAGGQPGSEQTVQLIGDPAGPARQVVALPDQGEDYFQLFAEDGQGTSPSPVLLRVSDCANVLELEPNDSPKAATPTDLRPPFALNGILQSQGDQDAFRLTARAGEQFSVQTFAARLGSPADTVVSIVGPDGREVVRNDDGADHDSVFRFVVPADGQYTLWVRDHLRRGGKDYVYRVEFLRVRPSLELAVPVLSDRRQQQRQAIAVARGSRFALMVTARRSGFSGPIELDFSGLPLGVNVSSQTIESGSHLGYVVFEATSEAPLSRGLINITGRAKTDAGLIYGTLKQRIGLTFGPPRQTIYHATEVDRIPLVVTESAPFELDVTPPKVPLVQDGRLALKVQVRRRQDFDGEISLSLPVLPPWVEVPEDGVRIPTGKDTAIFPITSTDQIQPRSWELVMVGKGSVDGQDVFVSSAPFDLNILRPYLSLEVNQAVTEQGQDTQVTCQLHWNKQIPGSAMARLQGLPKYVRAGEIALRGDETRITFPVTVGLETPASIHNTLFVELTVAEAGGQVTHFLGRGGVLEVLAEGKQARQTLSRLQILRQQQRQSSLATPPDKAPD